MSPPSPPVTATSPPSRSPPPPSNSGEDPQPIDLPDQLPIVGKHLAHALCMVFAFGLFFPGSLVSSLAWRVALSPGTWFKVHAILTWCGVGVAVAGLAVAVSMTPPGSHLIDPHKIVGIIVLIVSLVQPIFSVVCRNIPLADMGSEEVAGRAAWELVHKLAGLFVVSVALYVVASGYVRTQRLDLYGLNRFSRAREPEPPSMTAVIVIYACLLVIVLAVLVLGLKRSFGLRLEKSRNRGSQVRQEQSLKQEQSLSRPGPIESKPAEDGVPIAIGRL